MESTMRLTFERLEPRYAFDCEPASLDVNGDAHITPQDALVAINAYNDGNGVDTNCDEIGTPKDILNVINYINAVGNSTSQNIRINYAGGIATANSENQWSTAWYVTVEGSGKYQFDVLLESDDIVALDTRLRVVGAIDGRTDHYIQDANLGTIYRFRGDLGLEYTRKQLAIEFTPAELKNSVVHGVLVYEKWSRRLGQQLTQEIELNYVMVR
jgi:hypothetical protein